jgi:hypothetical protein
LGLSSWCLSKNCEMCLARSVQKNMTCIARQGGYQAEYYEVTLNLDEEMLVSCSPWNSEAVLQRPNASYDQLLLCISDTTALPSQCGI